MNDQESNALLAIPAGTGELFSIAGANLTWKVRSRQAGGDLCLFEQVLEPGEGVPLHTHSYPEAFYILSGTINFASDQPAATTSQCGPGDVVVARPQAHHSFYNSGTVTARLLSISVGAHERFFDAVEAADRTDPFAALPPAEAMARVAAIGAENDTIFCGPTD